jgi:hypothetical protein
MRPLHQALTMALGLVAVTLSGCTTEPIRMRVLDAVTAEPVKDAIAVYELSSSREHGTAGTQYALVETVSDANGWFYIPSQNVGFIFTALGLNSPIVKIFRRGYQLEWLGNDELMPSANEALRWEKNGETVKLKRPKDFAEYARTLRLLNSRLAGGDCGWKKTPLAILAIESEIMEFETSGRQKHNTTVLRSLLSYEAQSRGKAEMFVRCGSARAFFNTYPSTCPDGTGKMQHIDRRSVIDETKGSGTSIVMFTIGYCPSDGNYWLYEQGQGWRKTHETSLDFMQDKWRTK